MQGVRVIVSVAALESAADSAAQFGPQAESEPEPAAPVPHGCGLHLLTVSCQEPPARATTCWTQPQAPRIRKSLCWARPRGYQNHIALEIQSYRILRYNELIEDYRFIAI